MDLALVANVYFEEELCGKPFCFHPLLQYLPLLYGDEGDLVVVDRLPPADFALQGPLQGPRCVLASELSGQMLSPWGLSSSVVSFGEQHGLVIPQLSLEAIRTVSSKAFCFQGGFCVKGAALVHSHEELVAWSASIKGPKIVKSLYGMTGRGHYFFEQDPVFTKFPALAEPFVCRELDFSGQWLLTDKIHFLGVTHLINTAAGSYQATRVGDDKELFGSYYSRVQEALCAQKELLQKAFNKGFRGYCGIDAMIYEGGLLQPALEINGRKTMGQVALKISTKKGRSGTLFFSFKSQQNAEPLLPLWKKNQKQLWFNSF